MATGRRADHRQRAAPRRQPILVFGNDFDPNTPLSWTRSLAFALGMERSIVRYRGGGHTIATRATGCIAAITFAYLFDLVVPAEGTTCPARAIPFGHSSQRELRYEKLKSNFAITALCLMASILPKRRPSANAAA